MLTCNDVANYFLARQLQDEGAGEDISNLKLQKLVYYAQGFWLALKNEPLFHDPIEAWLHGPVVPKLYRTYQDKGANPIPFEKNLDFDKYTSEQKELFEEIYTIYGQYSAWKLRDMTHEESPWKKNYVAGVNKQISHADLTEYFKTQLKEPSA